MPFISIEIIKLVCSVKKEGAESYHITIEKNGDDSRGRERDVEWFREE